MQGLIFTSLRVAVVVSDIIVLVGVRAVVLSAFRTKVCDAATCPALEALFLEAFASGILVSRGLLGRRVEMHCASLGVGTLGRRVHLLMFTAVHFRSICDTT